MIQIRELLWTVGLAACASTDATSSPIAGDTPQSTPWPGILSSAVTAPPGTIVVSGWRGTAAYLSARPGTFDGATRVSISSPRAPNVLRIADIYSGGLDPVAVPAVAGDTLRVAVVRENGASVPFSLVVPAVSEPSVLRADPSSGAVDVPLNAQLSALFSEPVTLTQGMLRLLKDGVAVAGGVPAGASASTSVAFLPDATLSPGTSYDLDISTPVRGEHGSLTTPWHSRFTTRVAPERADLAIESFTMIEFQYPNDPSRVWYYAPQIRVRETTSRGGAQVTKLKFSTDVGSQCVSGLGVSPGETRDVFREIYGDYQLAFFEHNGAKWTARQVTVTVTYIDDTGRTATTSAVGPVVAGALPTSYTGGNPTTTVRPCQ